MEEKDLINQMVGKSSWVQKRRLEYIDACLFWVGRVNRSDLCDRFGVSVPQASSDLSAYRQLAGESVVYDRSEKAYLAEPNFRPLLTSPSSSNYLAQLFGVSQGILGEQTVPELPPVSVVPLPRRRVDVVVLKEVVRAILFKRKIVIQYLSMTNPEPSWRFISPHALAFDRVRWHTRAYCHQSCMFKDFVLSRILRVGPYADTDVISKDDVLWNHPIVLRLGPHPDLSEAQRNAIEHDYSMENGETMLETRAALVFYLLQQIKKSGGAGNAVEQQICILNREEVESELRSIAPPNSGLDKGGNSEM